MLKFEGSSGLEHRLPAKVQAPDKALLSSGHATCKHQVYLHGMQGWACTSTCC